VAPRDIVIESQRGSPDVREAVAAYDDEMKTIYLPEGWTGATPAERSVLVHPMVHHLQNLGKLKYEWRRKPLLALDPFLPVTPATEEPRPRRVRSPRRGWCASRKINLTNTRTRNRHAANSLQCSLRFGSSPR
jgi:hypothetical protein